MKKIKEWRGGDADLEIQVGQGLCVEAQRRLLMFFSIHVAIACE
jgi:hypothetical protein